MVKNICIIVILTIFKTGFSNKLSFSTKNTKSIIIKSEEGFSDFR